MKSIHVGTTHKSLKLVHRLGPQGMPGEVETRRPCVARLNAIGHAPPWAASTAFTCDHQKAFHVAYVERSCRGRQRAPLAGRPLSADTNPQQGAASACGRNVRASACGRTGGSHAWAHRGVCRRSDGQRVRCGSWVFAVWGACVNYSCCLVTCDEGERESMTEACGYRLPGSAPRKIHRMLHVHPLRHPV